MNRFPKILPIILFNHTIVSCGGIDDGGSLPNDGISSTTTIFPDYNSTSSITAVFGNSLFDSSYYRDWLCIQREKID